MELLEILKVEVLEPETIYCFVCIIPDSRVLLVGNTTCCDIESVSYPRLVQERSESSREPLAVTTTIEELVVASTGREEKGEKEEKAVLVRGEETQTSTCD